MKSLAYHNASQIYQLYRMVHGTSPGSLIHAVHGVDMSLREAKVFFERHARAEVSRKIVRRTPSGRTGAPGQLPRATRTAITERERAVKELSTKMLREYMAYRLKTPHRPEQTPRYARVVGQHRE